MDWVKQNKFLAGFIGVFVVGVLLLGFLLLSARSASNQALEDYDTVAKTVESLKGRPLFPKKENLTLIQEAEAELEKAVDALQASLTEYQQPLAGGMTDREFQDKLTGKIVDLNNVTQRRGVTMPEGFALGFDQYTGTLPRVEAVPKLDFSLEAIDRVVNLLVDEGVDEIVDLQRKALPVESAQPAAEKESERSSSRRSNSRRESASRRTEDAQPESSVIESFPFTIEFKATPPELRRILNALASTEKGTSFYNIELLTVRSSEVDGPPKMSPPEVVPVEEEEDNRDATPAEGEEAPLEIQVPEGQEDSRLVLGNDTLQVTARMAALRFVSASEDETTAGEEGAGAEEGAEEAGDAASGDEPTN